MCCGTIQCRGYKDTLVPCNLGQLPDRPSVIGTSVQERVPKLAYVQRWPGIPVTGIAVALGPSNRDNWDKVVVWAILAKISYFVLVRLDLVEHDREELEGIVKIVVVSVSRDEEGP
ncbi:unnamed protein product [Ilex paraguariensis]|uniref:Uncharacterized protein n=1 Tax=Ilex paraguariensis TaxID=185542 RepID=A0ABC8SLJ9_9AQUA